jgi:hypothetical protein
VQRLSLGRSLLGSAAVVTLLLGCGGLNGPPFVSSEGGAAAINATSGELLYVANDGASEGVSIVALPRGRHVARITNIGAPTGICSDASGNVWVSAYDDATRKYHLDKFVHGGTKPTERLAVPDGSFGCSVDPATGDLATWVASAGSAGYVEVFPGARRGKPVVYVTDFEPVSATYDNQGNIFADGIVNSGDFIVEDRPTIPVACSGTVSTSSSASASSRTHRCSIACESPTTLQRSRSASLCRTSGARHDSGLRTAMSLRPNTLTAFEELGCTAIRAAASNSPRSQVSTNRWE